MFTLEPVSTDPIATFDWTGFESPSAAVVAVLAAETGEDPAELDPLYATIDPDALDTLFAPRQDSSLRTPNGSIGFEYLGYWVVIKANGKGYVYESEDGAPSSHL